MTLRSLEEEGTILAGQPSSRLTSNESLVLLLSARPRSPANAQMLRVVLQSGVDWSYLLLAANRHGLLPLLYSRLDSVAPDLVPEGVKLQLQRLYEINSKKAVLSEEELRATSKRLEAEGIPTLTLRAPRLSHYYDSPADRQVEPVELLVERQNLRRARGLLLQSGYRRVHPFTGAHEETLLRSQALPLHNDALGLRLHLHDRLFPQFLNSKHLESHLVNRCLELSSDKDGVRGLSVEGLLLYSCITGSIQMWGKLLWLSDVALLVKKEDSLDWSFLLDTAREAGMLRMLLLGLMLAHSLLDAPIPAPIIELANSDARLVTQLRRTSARFLNDLRGHTSEAERLRFRLQLIDSPLEQLKFGASFATSPGVDDLKAVRLPDSLSAGYSLVRPVRLASNIAARLAGKVNKAPYFSTPMPLVEHMLRMADIGPSDVVYDLGCGDGRTVVAAAKLYGARGLGVDLDPARIAESQARAREAGVEHLVQFVQTDATKVDLSQATVVFLWLLPVLNLKMRPRLQTELPSGARIIAHAFDMGDWLPARTDIVSYEDDQASIAYLWLIPDRGEQPASERLTALP